MHPPVDPPPPPQDTRSRLAGAECRAALERLQPGYPGAPEAAWRRLLRSHARAVLYRCRSLRAIRLLYGPRLAADARRVVPLTVPHLLRLLTRVGLSPVPDQRQDRAAPGALVARAWRIHRWFGRLRGGPGSAAARRSRARQANRLVRGTVDQPSGPVQLSLWGEETWASLAARWVVPGCYIKQGRRKRDGSVRWLHVPSPGLADVQRTLSALVLRSVPPGPHACAFLPRRSIVPHVHAHAGAQVALVCDIRDFFGSVRPEQIRDALGMRCSPFPPDSHDAITCLVTWAAGGGPPGLPQGAPSSPAFANWVASRLDAILQRRLDGAFGPGVCRYTRYADDLAISSAAVPPDFHARALALVEGCVRQMGWWLHPEKTRAWSAGGAPLQLCGLNVPDAPGQPVTLPRAWKRRLRTALHRLRRESGSSEPISPEALREARGTVAYAYAVTGDARLLADCGDRVSALAEATGMEVASFLAGWREGAPEG